MSINVPENLLVEAFPKLDRIILVDRAINSETGLLEETKDATVNWTPLRVCTGDQICFTDNTIAHRYAFYEAQASMELSSTYCYDEESNWTTYSPALSNWKWNTEDMVILQDGYVRIEFQNASYAGLTLGNVAQLKRSKPQAWPLPPAFEHECERIISHVSKIREDGDYVAMLLSDMHHSTGDNWDDTLRNLLICSNAIEPNAVIQLGDLTDGLTPRAVTEQLANEVLHPLYSLGIPIYGCIGNHDVNYFKGNSDFMSARESATLYLNRDIPWYYVDNRSCKLRLIFLHSFDPLRKQRYGYSRECVRWLRKTLFRTPKDFHVLVFSHVPPLPEIHFWSDEIENGDAVITLLERFHKRRKGGVLGLIHGHNHADQLYSSRAFPIVSIGCAKFEFFQEKKPEGSFTPDRQHGEATQDLWDVLVVKPRRNQLEFVRFGAGNSRSVRSW